MNPIYPALDSEYLDHGGEISVWFFKVYRHSTHIFYFVEEALDDVAHSGEVGVVDDVTLGVSFCTNDSPRIRS